MNTFWLKVAGLAVLAGAVIVLIGVFSYSRPEPAARPETFYDVVERDDARLRAVLGTPPEGVPYGTYGEPKPEHIPAAERAAKAGRPQPEEIRLEERVQAERLFEMALAQRKMARLPGIGYKLMVDYCREIIEKFPDSPYAAKAGRMLREVPQRYRKQYKITDEEMDLSG